ncbi:hypothetical protein LCGC14_3142580, partial [marine sediment metagenome]
LSAWAGEEPEMILPRPAPSGSRDPLALAINQIVLRAVQHASDPTRHAEQITEVGLEPWKVQKVYAALRDGRGTTIINTAQVTTRLGRSIGELAAPARGLISKQYAPPPPNVGFRLLVDHIPQEVGKRDFFSGITLSPGSDARRAYEETSRNNFDAARREARRFRNLQAILAQADSRQRDGHFLANIADQTRGMEPNRAAEVLFQLAERYWIRGRWDLAAECYEVIAERHAAHPLAGAALVWLVQYYAGSEPAWRIQGSQRYNVQQVSKLSIDVSQEQDRSGRASELGKYAQRSFPALFARPELRFPLAVAHRNQGYPRQAERYFLSLTHGSRRDPWW